MQKEPYEEPWFDFLLARFRECQTVAQLRIWGGLVNCYKEIDEATKVRLRPEFAACMKVLQSKEKPDGNS